MIFILEQTKCVNASLSPDKCPTKRYVCPAATVFCHRPSLFHFLQCRGSHLSIFRHLYHPVD